MSELVKLTRALSEAPKGSRLWMKSGGSAWEPSKSVPWDWPEGTLWRVVPPRDAELMYAFNRGNLWMRGPTSNTFVKWIDDVPPDFLAMQDAEFSVGKPEEGQQQEEPQSPKITQAFSHNSGLYCVADGRLWSHSVAGWELFDLPFVE